MLNYNVDFDNRQAIHQTILISNALMLGALAWKGYQLKSRGAILVDEFKDNPASLAESIDAEIGYISREEAVQSYPQAMGLFHLLDKYNPSNEIIVTFTDSENSFIQSYHLSLVVPPLECFILLQEKLFLM